MIKYVCDNCNKEVDKDVITEWNQVGYEKTYLCDDCDQKLQSGLDKAEELYNKKKTDLFKEYMLPGTEDISTHTDHIFTTAYFSTSKEGREEVQLCQFPGCREENRIIV